jgi:hypothetical protein
MSHKKMSKQSMIKVSPFQIKDCALIAIATGKKAQNLRELKEQLTSIATDSIYYHFWGSLLRPRFDDPVYHNDFAIWAAKHLHDEILAERLAVIDPKEYESIEKLRHELIDTIDERLDEVDYPLWSSRDRQFEFICSQIVIFNTHNTVSRPAEFLNLFPAMSVGSIFYHFVDARRRTPNGIDDFRNWFLNFGKEYLHLCDRIAEIDPYFSSLMELRNQLHTVFLEFFRGGNF